VPTSLCRTKRSAGPQVTWQSWPTSFLIAKAYDNEDSVAHAAVMFSGSASVLEPGMKPARRDPRRPGVEARGRSCLYDDDRHVGSGISQNVTR
jgi:hypothetical protein